MFTVSLHKVRLFAPVGLYSEELLTGNEFEVDLDVWTTVDPASGFVDYVVLNRLIHEGFDAGHHTLEAICKHLHHHILKQFPFSRKARVCIRKLQPPMPGSIGYAQVCWES